MPADPMSPHEALAASERLLRESQRVAGIGSYEFDIAAGRWQGSAVMDEIFGIGQNHQRTIDGWLELLHPEDREEMRHYLIEEVLGRGVRFDREYRIIHPTTNVVRWVHGLGQLEFDDQRRPRRMLGTIQDISERKRQAEVLAERERTYREIFNATSDALFIHDESGRIIDVNDSMCAMFRCTRDMALTLTPGQLSEDQPPYTQADAAEHMRHALEEGPQVFSWHSRRCDGELFWTEVALRGCLIGGRRHVVASVRDISERKRATEERDHLFHLSQDLLAIGSLDGRFKQVNPAWTRLLGWSVEELISRPWMDFVHSDDCASTIAACTAFLANGGTLGFENRYRCKDGSYRLLSWSSTMLIEDGLFFAVARDLTETRRNEERIRQMQKMDAIGQLAGGVAHDFNNQLSGIMGYAEILTKHLNDPHLQKFAYHILTASHRAADLTRELLAFARKGQYRRTTVDIHEMIVETVGMLSRSIDRRISITKELQASNSYVLGDPTQIQNALLNLGLNARDAMPEGGILTYASDVISLQQGGDLPAGNYLQIQVRDTGLGLSAEAKAHLFEPFFTTKGPGKGTGMGLAAVYGTIRNHGGAISASSEPGQGTCFRILLPMATAVHADAAPVTDNHESRLRQLCILVVDDEPILRDLLTEILATQGHRVLQAANGRDAISVYRQHDGGRGIDLVILDMVMPEMNGRDCFRTMRTINPRIRALLASGFSLDSEAQSILDEGVLGFIQKPCRRDDLLAQIALAFDDRAG